VIDRSSEEIVLDTLDAVETRDAERLARLYHPHIEFHWPPALPYGGTHRGAGVDEMRNCFRDIWIPLQPTQVERRMDPQIVAARGEDVVARYTWRGRSKAGNTIAADTLAHYRVRDGKLASAQMYHFDLTALVDFLSAAEQE
jgi:ketosteroid isomerase-like protein